GRMHGRETPLIAFVRLLAALLLVALVAPGCATRIATESIGNYIAERSREWTASYVTGRTEAMEEILAEDFVGTSPGGVRYTKADAISAAKNGPATVAAARLVKIEVKVFDDFALAFGEDL